MGAKFMTIDIRNFLLSSHTPHPEFMKIHQDEILQDILDQFKAHLFIDSKGYVYFKITKGMNGIKQAAILAYITNWSRTSASMVITLFPHSRNAETPVLADHLLCLCGRFWYQVPLSRWRHPSRGALQEYCKITIDYVATHPNAVICNHRSDMVLYVDSDTGYLVLPEACSCMARQYFLSTDPTLTRTVLPNGPILTECCTIKHDVTSSAEAERPVLYFTVLKQYYSLSSISSSKWDTCNYMSLWRQTTRLSMLLSIKQCATRNPMLGICVSGAWKTRLLNKNSRFLG